MDSGDFTQLFISSLFAWKEGDVGEYDIVFNAIVRCCMQECFFLLLVACIATCLLPPPGKTETSSCHHASWKNDPQSKSKSQNL